MCGALYSVCASALRSSHQSPFRYTKRGSFSRAAAAPKCPGLSVSTKSGPNREASFLNLALVRSQSDGRLLGKERYTASSLTSLHSTPALRSSWQNCANFSSFVLDPPTNTFNSCAPGRPE